MLHHTIEHYFVEVEKVLSEQQGIHLFSALASSGKIHIS